MSDQRSRFRNLLFMFLCGCLLQTGCLSLGGRTTYVQEKPETAGRITALETRVTALEQALSTGTPNVVLRTPDEETSPGVIGN
jgi:hypothetical protein